MLDLSASPRARSFPLAPGEDAAAWQAHLRLVAEACAPGDGLERELVVAIAAAMWREARADRLEAGLWTGDGLDLARPGRAAALAGLLRYQAAAGAATARAVRALLACRRAKAAVPRAAAPARSKTRAGRPAKRRTDVPAAAPSPEPATDAVVDADAWLAGCPVVEAEPEVEARRRALLAELEPPSLRLMLREVPCAGLEQFLIARDPVAYEAWFARQPKPAFEPLDLPESWKDDIARVTRHNPPWARDAYLGYYRPPVPAELLAAPAAPAPPPTEPEQPAEPAPPPVPLAARIARLLDRSLPRTADELDLAEAICALRWPKWPAYRGPIDLAALRRALAGFTIDAATLNWLGGKEIVRACSGAGA